jgi:hypothetical protein
MTVKQILKAIKECRPVYHIWDLQYHTNPGPRHVMVTSLIPTALRVEIILSTYKKV